MGRKRLIIVFLCSLSYLTLLHSGCKKPYQKPVESLKSQADSKALPATIKFEETSIDFGKIGPATKHNKDLKFQNTGQGPLIIEVIACCGTVAETDKKEYKPGETGILKIQYQAANEVGISNKELKIYSNDKENPKIIISLTADVIQKVLWEPEQIKLLLDVENAACPKISIKCIDGQEFAITGIISTGNCMSADYNPTIKKTEHILDLKVDTEKLSDHRDGKIVISMNHPEGTIATIYFKVVQKYEVIPNTITFDNLSGNESLKKTIKVFSNYHKDFEIESTSSEKNTVKLVGSKKIDNGYELDIEIVQPPEIENDKRIIDTFYINIKDEKQLTLKCYEYYKN